MIIIYKFKLSNRISTNPCYFNLCWYFNHECIFPTACPETAVIIQILFERGGAQSYLRWLPCSFECHQQRSHPATCATPLLLLDDIHPHRDGDVVYRANIIFCRTMLHWQHCSDETLWSQWSKDSSNGQFWNWHRFRSSKKNRLQLGRMISVN